MQAENSSGEEQRIAVGGAFDRRAGCLLIPFIPVRAAGALIVTSKRVIFDPILHYKLVAKKVSIDLDEIDRVESTGGNIGINLTELVTWGKTLTIRLKDGKSKSYRSMQADDLAEIINRIVDDAGARPEGDSA